MQYQFSRESEPEEQGKGMPPVQTAPDVAEHPPEVSRKQRGGMPVGVKAACIVVVSVALIVMITAVANLFILYDISISSGTDGLEVMLAPKALPEETFSWPFDEEVFAPGQTPKPQDDEPDALVSAAPLGDGTTLEINGIPVDPESGEFAALSLQEIYTKCLPSIVSVEVAVSGGYSSGTGVVMTDNGYILTNAHVVEGARRIDVVFESGKEFNAALIGQDDTMDLAVLKIDAKDLTPADFGDSDLLQVGEEVAVIGNPLGQLYSMTNGIVSAVGRDMENNGGVMSLIQTNAAINEGNSGGPLINMYGQVVGITNMKLVGTYYTASVEGMGFAIPTAAAKPVVDELIERGYVASGKPGIGITTQSVPEGSDDEREPGIHVISVSPESDAAKKGILPGDMIVACNGTPVMDTNTLNDMKNELEVGDTLTLTIKRSGKTFDVEIELIDTARLTY